MNAVVGFRTRDQTTITSKWDAVLKCSDSLVVVLGLKWWGLSKEQKREVSRVQKLPLEFTQERYMACELWVGRRM